MFGQMTISPTLHIDANSNVETAVATLLEAAEQPEVAAGSSSQTLSCCLRLCQAIRNRAQFTGSTARTGLGTPSTSMIRNTAAITSISLRLFSNNAVSLVERPGLLRSGLPWRLEMGKGPEARLTETTFEVN
jgi:hypothetical protein